LSATFHQAQIPSKMRIPSGDLKSCNFDAGYFQMKHHHLIMSIFPKKHKPDLPTFTDIEIAFLGEHAQDDVNKLLLQTDKFKGLDIKKMARQIAARQKTSRKLPEWCANLNLIFPQTVSVEQSSSEATARYKANLISGKKLIDITGGMGVDCYYLSKRFAEAEYYEEQAEVERTAAFNFNVLAAHNITTHPENSLQALTAQPISADWIYADPARRDVNKAKVVSLLDCTPDIVQNLPLLLSIAPRILLKTSPLLDIDLAVKQLKHVTEVHAIGYEQECKELLFILNKEHLPAEPVVKGVILDANGDKRSEIVFTRSQENEVLPTFSPPLSYLYEPHPAVLKSGGFKTLCRVFNVNKLAPNSHLYTSDLLCNEFPGRTFRITGLSKPDIKEISKYIKTDKANLTTRNFPSKIQDLRKKWRLKEGGDFYLFATTLSDGARVVIVTEKAKSDPQ
jgi:hypothetical protein